MIFSKEANQDKYPFILPELPFHKDSFIPHFSAETFDYHHGKHHQAYVNKLNKLLEKDPLKFGNTLEEIIINSNSTDTGVFNNAGQIWNHTFFWHSIKPKGGGIPPQNLLNIINKAFGNFDSFSNEFSQAAIDLFGSGWVWLVYDDEKLRIVKTGNAESPITKSLYPLIACDVWEHAYYVDYRNNRASYISDYLNHMINWDFAAARLI